jgi:hypothetical protein
MDISQFDVLKHFSFCGSWVCSSDVGEGYKHGSERRKKYADERRQVEGGRR